MAECVSSLRADKASAAGRRWCVRQRVLTPEVGCLWDVNRKLWMVEREDGRHCRATNQL